MSPDLIVHLIWLCVGVIIGAAIIITGELVTEHRQRRAAADAQRALLERAARMRRARDRAAIARAVRRADPAVIAAVAEAAWSASLGPDEAGPMRRPNPATKNRKDHQ